MYLWMLALNKWSFRHAGLSVAPPQGPADLDSESNSGCVSEYFFCKRRSVNIHVMLPLVLPSRSEHILIYLPTVEGFQHRITAHLSLRLFAQEPGG